MSQCKHCGEAKVTNEVKLTETRLFDSYEDYMEAEQLDVIKVDVHNETDPVCVGCGKKREQ